MNFPIGWVVLFLILIPVSSIIGILTNAILIAAFRSRRDMGTTDMMFFSLAVSDLIYDGFSFFGSIVRFIRYNRVDFGSDLTKTLLPVFFQCVYVIPNSIAKYLMTVISIERAVAVLWPSYFYLHWTKRKALFTIISGATIVAITAVPFSLQMKASPKDNITADSPGMLETTYTDLFNNNRELFRLHNTSYQVLFGILPILIVLVMNIATVFGLFRMERKVGQFTPSGLRRIAAERKTIQTMSTDLSVVNLRRINEYSTTERRETSITEDHVANLVCQGAQHFVVGGSTSAIANDGVKNSNKSPKHEPNPCVPGTALPEIIHEDINIDRTNTQQGQSSQYFLTTTREQPKNDESLYSKIQKKISVTLVIISVVFLILNLPSKLLFVIIQGSSDSTYKEESSLQLEVYIGIVLFCELLNTIVNSIIFVIRSDKYRSSIYDSMRCCFGGDG